jgi:hypothetical protein
MSKLFIVRFAGPISISVSPLPYWCSMDAQPD